MIVPPPSAVGWLWIIAVLSFVWLALQGAAQAASPWPTFHHDNARTGLSPVNTAANTGVLKWEFQSSENVTSVESSPAIGADGTIYFGGDDSNVYALNANGTLKWLYGAVSVCQSSPVIGSDGTVYIGCDSNLYALNSDGTLKWKFNLHTSAEWSPVVSADGTIYMPGVDSQDKRRGLFRAQSRRYGEMGVHPVG